MKAGWLVGLAGCVVAVDESVTIDEPVDVLVVTLSNGDVTVVGAPGPVIVDGAIGGPSDGANPYRVIDGVLTIAVDCAVCGGSIEVRAPPDTVLELGVGTGSIDVSGMDADVRASVELGDVDVRDHGLGEVVLDARLGSASLDRGAVGPVRVDTRNGDADLRVPAGRWDLELSVHAGRRTVAPGIVDDPDGPPLRASVRFGSLTVGVAR